MLSLKSIHKDNFKANTCSPYKILNEISRLDLKELFPEVVAVLKIFLTIPVTVASGERSFSQLNLIKSAIRSCMGQDRPCHHMNWQVARKIDLLNILLNILHQRILAFPNFFEIC